MAKTKIEKVNIESLVATLIYVYNMGAEYVDIIIVKKENEDNDTITVSIRDEYLTSKDTDHPLPEKSIPLINKKDIDNFFDEIS